jgi:hypothetical protein
MLCCLGCAIFGITEVPTDGVEFDTGELSDSGTQETSPTAGTGPAGVSYAPPSVQPDLEKGETAAPTSATATPTIQEPLQPHDEPPPSQPPADRLDNVEQGNPKNVDELNVSLWSEIHELD